MKVLIIGAHGKVGQRISKLMSTAEQFEPTAFIRKEAQKPFFEALGVPTIVASLESAPEVLENIVKDFDAVVFTAGSGGATGADKTMEIDLDGAIKTMQAAEKQGVQRFVMVSASQADNRAYWGTVDGMKPYFIAKHYADAALQRSSLDYTILRPVLLTDDDEAGTILMVDSPDKVGDTIPRQAVAETVLAVLPNASTYGKVIEMSSGADEITKAIDTFCEA